MHRLIRLPAAALLLANGLVHLGLWLDGYRSIPDIGPLFLANVVVSVVAALAVVVLGSRLVLAAAAVFTVGSLAALVVSRSSIGLLGFMEGWTADAQQILGVELAALVALMVAWAYRAPRLSPIAIPVGRGRRSR